MSKDTRRSIRSNRGLPVTTVSLLASAMLVACSDSDSDSSPVAETPVDTNFDVRELTIADAHDAMLSGELTCTQLVESYLDRIQRLDQDLAGGYPINSVLWVNEQVRDNADALDDYLAQTGELQGSLHCVPVLLKDNYETADMPTTAGSLTMLGNQSGTDATTVYKMRQAGAIMLGKATMDAWAMGAGGASSRPRAGSPYDTAYLTGSSSSGPAAAASANLAMAAAGSDTCGSLVGPATLNGLVTIRGSYGLISQNGIVPLAHSHDIGGPLTRTVEDATRILNVMAGVDSLDPTTVIDPTAVRYDDYTQFLKTEGAAGKRIGILRTYGDSTATPEESESAEAVAAAIQTLEDLGAEILDPIDFEQYNGHYLADYEAEDDLNAYFASNNTPVANIEALADDPLVHPNVRARILERVIPQIDTDAPEYEAMLQDNAETKDRLHALMDANDLDALVLEGGNACALSVSTGVPYMIVPASGERTGDDPRPTSLGIMTRKWDEPVMLEIGYAYEQARGNRPAPTVESSLAHDTVLPPLEPSAYNACVEEIALTARRIQGDEFRNVTADEYRRYVTEASCSLETHVAAGVK